MLAASLGVEIVNRGASGARSDEIAVRQGGLVFTATVAGNTIPASGAVNLTNLSVDSLRGGEVTNFPVEIAGVRGTLARSGSNRVFTRATAGSAVPVRDIVDVVGLEGYEENIQLIAVGTNDIPLIEAGTRTFDEVCANIARMVTHLVANNLRYLVWSPLDRGVTEGKDTPRGGWLRQIEAFCARQVGDRFFNLREYLATRGLMEAGVTPTAADTSDMNAGSVPTSLCDLSSVHLNSVGMQVQAVVFDRILRRKKWFTAPGPGPGPIVVPTDPEEPGDQWSPTDHGTDLLAWYDPSVGTDGTTVTTLADKSSYSRNIDSVTGTPVFDADGLNGHPCIVFDGASRLKAAILSGGFGTGPFTVLVNAQATGSSTEYICDGHSTNHLAIYKSSTSGFGARRINAAGAMSQGSGDANPHSFIAVFDGANSKFYRDGAQVAVNDQGTGDLATAGITTGSNGTSSSFLTGKVGEYVLVRGALTATQVASADAWLKSRRGA